MDSPVFNIQDPFFTNIKGELIVGGVLGHIACFDEDKKAFLYTGVSDRESQIIEINNPFIDYMENNKRARF